MPPGAAESRGGYLAFTSPLITDDEDNWQRRSGVVLSAPTLMLVKDVIAEVMT
jgi:hypothetical protein